MSNTYLTTKEWEEIKEYVKNRRVLTDGYTVEDVPELVYVKDTTTTVTSEPIMMFSTRPTETHSDAYNQMIQATSVSEMYEIMLTIMNDNPESLYEMSADEIQGLYDTATEMNEENPGDDYVDLIDTLQYIAGDYDLNGAEVLVNYIYFDLYKGNVTITNSTYSGKDKNGNNVSGTHSANNQYYVYQSKTSGNSYDSNGVPVYSNMSSWISTITNNSNVSDVVSKWKTQASAVGKTETNNRIHITTSTNCNLTIGNIWSTYTDENPAGRSTASIAYVPPSNATGCLTVTLIGHSRLDGFHINNNNAKSSRVVITSNSLSNSLTVASTVDGGNYWSSAIGNCDSNDSMYNLTISGGTIFAGTTSAENCTAIGGGGNGFGGVTITGGVVTAVASTSGTAIGGGIGYSSKGGDAEVTISGGTVYAYNHCALLPLDDVYYPVPSAAIGGGSSVKSNGNENTTVNISGGTVYAQSVGGVAIGGGGSTTLVGGTATVNITGGNITARSVRGSIVNGTESTTVLAGVSIGGGTGCTAGGNATVTISGNAIVNTGSIGGGKSTGEDAPIGFANVTINGGTIHGQVIMASGSTTPCSFVMNGGTINNGTNANVYWENGKNEVKTFAFIEGNGGAVYVQSGTALMTGGTIQNCMDLSKKSGVGDGGGAFYVGDGSFVMTGGTICNCDGHNGGAVLVKGGNVTIDGTDTNEANRPRIYNNTSRDGGGVMSWGNTSKMTIKNAQIYKNATNGSGGGAYAHSGSTIDLLDGVKIYENSAVGRGGGASSNGILTITGAIIEGNITDGDGGGVFANANITFNSGIIRDNTAKNGGGASVNKGNFIMLDGMFDNNTADIYGGSIYAQSGDVTVNSGTISNNIALSSGGAIAVIGGNVTIGTQSCHDAGSSSTHAHPIIDSNVAANGGGIYVNGGSTTMWCGDIKDNRTYEETVNVLVNGGSFSYSGGTIGIPFDSGVYVDGGDFIDNTTSEYENLDQELHYHSYIVPHIQDRELEHNYYIPESKWIGSPKGNVLHIDPDDNAPTWGDLFPEYEFVGWISRPETDTDEIINLWAIWADADGIVVNPETFPILAVGVLGKMILREE